MIEFIAGEDIKAGQLVFIREGTNLVYIHRETFVIDELHNTHETFTVDRAVQKDDAITLEVLQCLPTSLLRQPEWAVLTDDGVHLDLTYQEAQQLETALNAQKVKGVALTTNAAGKRAQERGYVRVAEDN